MPSDPRADQLDALRRDLAEHDIDPDSAEARWLLAIVEHGERAAPDGEVTRRRRRKRRPATTADVK